MDEQELNNEFMTILSESHPGLTFEEYRDSCVFLLFYNYLCIRDRDKIEECYQLGAMVRLAIRGKLQMPSFLQFIDAASPFIFMANRKFRLTDFSFYKKLEQMQSQEKQKSYARFFRKLIKKLDGWKCDELLLRTYPKMFQRLMSGFARMKKETYISDDLLKLYNMLLKNDYGQERKICIPDFQYGILSNTMIGKKGKTQIYGYEENEDFMEIFQIGMFLNEMDEDYIHIHSKEEWKQHKEYKNLFDLIGIFMPEGVEPGEFMSDPSLWGDERELIYSKSKGEFPFLLSAFPYLNEYGMIAVVFPSAFLYREGKEMQIRKYIIEELDYLDTVMLLPDHIFHSVGQDEALVLLKKNRKRDDVMFFDCSEIGSFNEEQLESLELAWQERNTIPGLCTSAKKEDIKENEYNLNLPRYIVKSAKEMKIDIQSWKNRIMDIDKEIREIDEKIAMYRRDLELQ